MRAGRLTVPCDTTLYLGSYDLTVSGITIGAGRNFTVAGPTDGTGGTLTANGSSINEFAGIRTVSPAPKPTTVPPLSPTPKPTATPTTTAPAVTSWLRRAFEIVIGVLSGWLASGNR